MKSFIAILSKIILLLIFIAALIFVGKQFFLRLSFSDIRWDFSSKERMGINKDEKVFQKFKSTENNLSQIGVLFASSEISQSDRVVLEVRDEDCSETLRRVELSPVEMSNDYLTKFRFEKIPDSKDKVFCVALSFGLDNKTDRLKIYLLESPPLQSIGFIRDENGEWIEKEVLAIRPAYLNDSLWQNFNELNQRISQYKPYFLKHYPLYFISFGFIILSIVLIIIILLL